MTLDSNFDETVTSDDIVQNEIRNKKFQDLTPEHEMLLKFFKNPDTSKSGEYMTTTDIVNYLMSNGYTRLNLRPVNIGKALSQENYDKRKTGGSTVYLIEKFFS